MMEVALVNDGPVTFMLDSQKGDAAESIPSTPPAAATPKQEQQQRGKKQQKGGNGSGKTEAPAGQHGNQ